MKEEKDLKEKIEGMTKEEKIKYLANQLSKLSNEFDLPLYSDCEDKQEKE
ncbi:MAG TPA: hypothetical protein GX005_07795 [Bacteroidales bacterium]|nr:hypothetical protein [Bacteroidales bacterium]